MAKLQISITGDVQGVGFRWSAREKAEELGLHLHIAENTPDGSVRFVVEGKDEVLQKFVEWAKMGPVDANVGRIDVHQINQKCIE